MSVLVLAEHDQQSIKKATLTPWPPRRKSAATSTSGRGHNAGGAAKAAAQIAGSPRCCTRTRPPGRVLAENVASLVVALAKSYTHILAPATSNGKDVMPRAAALLDVQQVSEIVAVESAEPSCARSTLEMRSPP